MKMSKGYLYNNKILKSIVILVALLYLSVGDLKNFLKRELIEKIDSCPLKQRGISLGLFSKDPNYDYIRELKEIKGLGANYVQIAFTWFIKDIYSTEIYPKEGLSPFKKTIIDTIREAHNLGLKVFLFPILKVDRAYLPWHWRGKLSPLNKEEWFKRYKEFIVKFAEIAERENVELFSLGSEFNSMDIYTDRWYEIIEEIRKVYRGKLTYSSNWDHYKKVKFWDRLDYIGVTGYFELLEEGERIELRKVLHSWREYYLRIIRWQNHWKKPLIITEIGYRSKRGSLEKPWKWGNRGEPSMIDQLIGYIAFIRVWSREERLEGVYFWNWYGEGGERCDDYTPKGKPSQIAIKYWFKGEI